MVFLTFSSLTFVFPFLLGMAIYRKEPRGVGKFAQANLLLSSEGADLPERVVACPGELITYA